MRRVLFWSCLPFVLPQAILVRRNAPRFSGAGGSTCGSVGKGPRKRLLGIGDSIIAGVGAPTLETALVGKTAQNLANQLECCIDWQALGKIGITTEKIIPKLMGTLPKEKPDFIVLSVGVNDVTSLKRTQSWAQQLQTLFHALHTYAPNALIVMVGLPPLGVFPLLPQPLRYLFGVRAKTFDHIAQDLTTKMPQTIHVPIHFQFEEGQFAADGFHPSQQSYQTFGEEVAQAIVMAQTLTNIHAPR